MIGGSGSDPDLRLARAALSVLGVRARLRRVATGLDTTYRATAENSHERFAVRVGGPFDFRRPAAVEMEAAWIGALSKAPVVVPALRGAGDGTNVIVVHDGQDRARGCLVLDWLRGTKMRWRFTTTHAFRLAAATAHLHRHAAREFFPPEGAWAKTWSPGAMCGPGSLDTLEAVAGADAVLVVRAIERRLSDATADLGESDWHLINADIGPHNTLWYQGRPALFDFNDLGWGYSGFDFARYLHGLRWRDRGDDLVQAAIAGYQSVQPLPSSWTRHGDTFEVAAGLFLARYLAPKIGERPEAPETISRLIQQATRHLA